MKKLLLFLFALVTSVGTWADNVTFTYSDYKGQGKTSTGSDYTMDDKTYVSIGDTKFYGNNNQAHFYAEGTITVTPKRGVTITKVEITTTSTSYNGYQSSGKYTASTGSVAKNTSDNTIVEWTGSATSAFTLEHDKQIRWTSIVVTYSSSKTLSSIAVKTAPTKTIYTEGEVFTPAGLQITKTYDDATTEDITYSGNESNFTFSPSLDTPLVPSNTSISITVGGKSTNQAITVNAIPSHTAHFSINGTIDNGNDQSVKEGRAITFPTDPEDVNGKKFVGWTKTADYSSADTKPSDICTEADMGDADVTYYAVFATQEGTGSESLVEITDVNQVVTGTYALISYDEAVYVSNAAATNACPSQVTVSKTSGNINIVDGMKWTVTGNNTDGYIFESVTETGKYLWGGSANDGPRVNTTSGKAAATKNWFVIEDATYGVVLYNKASDPSKRYLSTYTSDWRNYTSISNTQKAANLYKVTPGYTYSDYCTTASAPTPTFASLDELIEANLDENTVVNVTISDEVAMAMANPMTGAYMVSLKNSEVILAAPGSDLGWKNGATVSGTLENVTWDPYNYALTGETNFWSTLTYDYAGPSYDGTIDFMAASEDGYYTTFSNNEAVTIPYAIEVGDEYVYFTVYSVYADGNKIELQDLTEGLTYNGEIWLSENEGYLIKAEITSEEYNFTGSTVFSVGYTNVGYDLYGQDDDNALRPASEAKTGDNKYYMLAYSNNSCTPASLGFYWGAANGAAFESRDNSAYLALPAASTPAAVRGFAFNNGEATAIKTVNATANKTVRYNLNGQRVNTNAKGIIVTNGKKHLVK